MAEAATLARPYANAVFALAKERGRLGQWSRMLALLAAAARTRQVRALIGAPALTGEVKAHQLIALGDDGLDEPGRRFVRVLAENKRLDLLPAIAAGFEARKAEAERVLEVEVRSAVALGEQQRQAYASALRQRFEQEIHLEVAVDEDLVGGAVVHAGDTVIDGSLRGRLARLEEALRRA